MDAINHLLTRGVDTIYPTREALEKVLRSGKKLRLYQGFDPTGTQLHIGHAVALRKLRQFQELGHEVIFLIGDFTAMIGDPTGKMDSRKMLTKEEVLRNAENYKDQAGRILRFEGENSVQIKYNSEWLGKVSALEFLQLSHHLTYQQVVERDMFQKRMGQGQDVYMNEFLYPVMQAYDSVAMDVDLEIGGSDQMFNMMMGRKLMRNIKKKDKFVMTVPLLTDAHGVKIGKTEGNVIGLTDAPADFYGKIMSLGDDAIIPCLTLLTDTSMEEIESVKNKIAGGANPITFKKQLAFELTRQFNSESDAKAAQNDFENKFQSKTTSSDTFPTLSHETVNQYGTISESLYKNNLVSSRTEAKRLMKQHAVKLDDVQITSDNKPNFPIGSVLKVGKTKFIKII